MKNLKVLNYIKEELKENEELKFTRLIKFTRLMHLFLSILTTLWNTRRGREITRVTLDDWKERDQWYDLRRLSNDGRALLHRYCRSDGEG